MNITKDEARILAAALNEAKYDFVSKISDTKEEASSNMQAFVSFETRLEIFSQDERRQGRTSQNFFTDCLRRFCKK